MKQLIAEWINVIFGARKFLLMMVLYTTAIVFRWDGLIDGAQFVDLLKDSTLAFMAANGCEHMVSAIRSYFENKAFTDDLVPPNEIEPTKKAQ